MRIDVFLDAVCLFKSRTMSSKACQEGIVKINGSGAKPSKEIKEDDILEIRNFTSTKRFRVLAIPQKNVKKSDVGMFIQFLTGLS
ncbi:RNA-binding S4 domain-containing protein [candidate division WOR-3 bacterium]|nr:RNA-binding S4 domain-containing protein [candidate division WOR-3 bacterium]